MNVFKALLLAYLLLPILSKGQLITVTDELGAPVNQAVIYLKSIESNDKQVLITNSEGHANFSPVIKKVQLFISHVSFENHIDTLNSLEADIQIKLVERKVKLDEIVVTSEYKTRTISESVHTVTVINKDQIENQAAPDLAALLSQQLSMRINQDNVLGAELTMNGLTGQNIKILIDGVPIIGRLNGNIDLGQVNLNNVERIEVVNGPMAASYGTDAAGGVINLITKQGVDQKRQAGANILYESIGQYNMDAFSGFSKGSSSLLVSGGRNFFDGWSEADTGRWQTWKPKEQYFGNIKYRYTFKNLVLNYQFNAFHEKLSNKGNPKILPYSAYAKDEYYTTTRYTNQLGGSYIFNRELTASGTLSYSTYDRKKNTYRKDMVTLDQTLTPGTLDQDTTLMNSWMARFVINKSTDGGQINYQGGVDISVDNAKGTRFKSRDINAGDYAVFASAEYQPVKTLLIKPAIRISYNTGYNAPVVPSLMVKYDLSHNYQVRASYGKGYRAPGIKERYLYFVDINHDIHGNENLLPEYSDNFFLSFSRKWAVANTMHNTQISGFYNDIRNLITLAQPDPSKSLYTYINIGSFSTHGGTLTHGITWKNLTLNAGAGFTGRYNIYADSGDFKKYIYSPDFNANAQYLFSKIDLSAAVYFKYNGKLPGYKLNSDGTISQFSNSSYKYLDASLRKGFFNKHLYVAAGIKNILNVTHIDSFSQGSVHSSASGEQSVGTGRTYFARVQYMIGKK